ncbi:MAG: S-methyl-5'-thioadenosine phosphorylase [Anaerolineales bacterium]|nr:S-methyl-5'-thioadenosine phosphorylase [Anaerolineales bacterium]
MTDTPHLAIIGGSGLYDMPGLEDKQDHIITTPFGEPSAPVITGTLEGRRVAFLARHGLKHTISPTHVNYRANIYALKSLGARWVVAVSACGSLREDFEPGHIVVPNQLFDFTRRRISSFFDDPGLVTHVGVADPFCHSFSKQLHSACVAAGATAHLGADYITVEGPRFSTRAESNIYRSWGLSIIGMTTSPEAFLAREAELCYAVMAHVTDYDVWHHEPVSVDMVMGTMQKNTHHAQGAIRELAANLQAPECNCENALADALITHKSNIDPAARQKLGLLVDKYLNE